MEKTSGNSECLQCQLRELENLYAEYLLEDINKRLLKIIHNKIKNLRVQLQQERLSLPAL